MGVLQGWSGIRQSYVYGAEYETNTVSGYMSTLHNHDVPCLVCLVRNRSVVNMFRLLV